MFSMDPPFTPEHQLFVAVTRGAIVGYGRAALFEPGPDAPADAAPRGFYLTGVFVLEPNQAALATPVAETFPFRLAHLGERLGFPERQVPIVRHQCSV